MTTTSTFNTYPPGLQAKIISDLMDLFKSNSRGYGIGEFSGAKFNEDKNKWTPGHVRWVWGQTTPEQWMEHLSGSKLLGQGVLCDDNKVWYSCLDIDSYEIDYSEEMGKIQRSGLPLVVFRTKSAGLRVTVFFSEPIEADLVIPRMKRVASTLGYAGCEIFPKQTTLIVEQNDCPSWIYMPFGGTHDMFSEQGCMNETGGLMELDNAIAYAISHRISKSNFMEMFAGEDAARTNGKTNGKKHPKGAWVEEESYDVTINTMFWDGPPCLWIIAHRKCRDMQNNFLMNVSTFLKKKYPENWDKALEWVNYNVLQPIGDREKLTNIIKRLQGHEYEYMCNDEPIQSFCDPHACRRMAYGVGSNGASVDFYEMGMTIVERVPRIFFISYHSTRMNLDAGELISQQRFKEKCLSHGIPTPTSMKRDEWEKLVNTNIENAVIVQPSEAIRTNSYEIGLLRRFLSIRIPTFMRIGEDDKKDKARLRLKERRIYFKWNDGFGDWIRDNYHRDYHRLDMFVNNNCEYHTQDSPQGRVGIRGWWRNTYSISFDEFDEEIISYWLNIDKDTPVQ